MKKVVFYICSSLLLLGLTACETSSSSQIEEEEENNVALWVHSDRTELITNGVEMTCFEHYADTVVFDANVKKLKLDSISIDGEVIDYGVTLNSGETLDCSWIHLHMSDYKLSIATDSFPCNSRKDMVFNVSVSGSVDAKTLACYKVINLIGYEEPGPISFAADTLYFSNRNLSGENFVIVDESVRKAFFDKGYYGFHWEVAGIEVDGRKYGYKEGVTYNSLYGDGMKLDWVTIKRDGDFLKFQVDKNMTGRDRSFTFYVATGPGQLLDCGFVGIQWAD